MSAMTFSSCVKDYRLIPVTFFKAKLLPLQFYPAFMFCYKPLVLFCLYVSLPLYTNGPKSLIHLDICTPNSNAQQVS